MRFNILLLCTVLLSAAFPVVAGEATVQFSADTIETGPEGGSRKGRLYVGNDQVRTEFDMDGQTMVQIVDLRKQEALMINPQEKTFIRRSAGQAPAMPQQQQDASPCAGMQNISCQLLGKESVNGRPAQKWEFVNTAQESADPMLFWLDEERKIPVRQIMPDGSSMELSMLGAETLHGRKAEKWELISIGSDGKSGVTYQWYDPEIKINLREEGPGGYARDLKNIKVGPQPPELFMVPAGYSEMGAPQDGE